jgi:hypothetical protein
MLSTMLLLLGQLRRHVCCIHLAGLEAGARLVVELLVVHHAHQRGDPRAQVPGERLQLLA